MHFSDVALIHLTIIWIKAKFNEYLHSFLSLSSLYSSSQSSSLTLVVIILRLVTNYLRLNIEFIKNLLGFYLIQCYSVTVITNDSSQCQYDFQCSMENTQFRHVRSTSFEMTATEETLSQRDFRVGRRLLSNEAAMNALEQVECCKHIQFSDVTGGDYYHNSRIQLSPYRYNHQYQQQRHCILNSRNLYYRFYIAFIYLLILFSVQCIHSKPTSLSMKRDLNVTSSSLMYTSAVIPSLSSIINSSYSSSSLSSVSPIIWSSPSTVAIASNILPSVKNKSLSTDDLLFEYLDILTNPNFNASHANDIRITNVFMRSQRTKRSLSFYMSNLDTSPLFLVSSIKNDVTEQKYLSIHDNGTVRLVNSHRHISAMITVSVIVEWSTLMNKDQLLKSLRPRDGSRLIIRKFAKNVCICMYPNGTVFTERIINQTITDSCEWRLRVSRHGIGFERELSEDDINNGSAEFYASNSPSKTIPNNRSPTLSVTDEQSNTLASGWTHWLWQPEATWQVYGVKPSALKAFTEAQNDTTNYQRFISIYIENLNQKGVTAEYKNSYQSNTQNLTSTTFASSSPTLSPSSNPTVKVGSQQVIVLEAPAYYFNTLHHKAKYKHCRTLKSKLAQLVQTELLVSFRILDRYREAFKKLLYIVQKYSATNNNTDNHQYIDNNNKPTPYKIAELLDQWLMLLDYKWRQTTRQSYKMNSTFNNCSLSFKSSFEINTVGNDSSDRILVKLYETRLKTKIYYGLFENLQHIVEWTNDEKHYWLQHPRIIKLFHYLHIKCPSSQKLRQASFILRQYLPKYSPEDIHSRNTLNYGLMGDLKSTTFRKLLNNDIKLANILIDRATYMKFEEYYFWPILRRVNNKAVVEHSVFLNRDLRNEIKQMSPTNICYQVFMKQWKFYKKRDSTDSCLD